MRPNCTCMKSLLSSIASVKTRCLATAVAICACALLLAFPQCTTAQTSSAAGDPGYRDPQGRFTLRIPKGWNASQLNNDVVQFFSGTLNVTMLTVSGSDPNLSINAIGTQTGQQWKNFKEIRQTTVPFGGQAGQYATYSGLNPKGVDSYFELLGTTDGTFTYLLMTSVPKADAARLKTAFSQIQGSFQMTSRPSTQAAAATSQPGANAPVPPPLQSMPQPPAASAPAAQGSLPKTSSGGGNVYYLKLVRIVDERGFERPMTAMTVLIPTDWEFQGTVQYGTPGCHANLVHLAFRAASRDGRLGMELFPGNVWQWNDDAGMRNAMQASGQQSARFGRRDCELMPPMTADAYLRRRVVPAARSGAQVLASEPMRDMAQSVQEEANRELQATGLRGLTARTDVGRVRLRYSLGSAPVEEWVTAITYAASQLGPSYNMRTGRMGQARNYTNAADHIYAMRAPQGELDKYDRFFQLIMSNVRVDPQWQARVQQVIANMQAQDSKAAMDRSAIATKYAQDSSKIIHDTYQNATTSRDRAMEGWSQYMRGVQTFRNPNTGEKVELSNQYGKAWAGPNNTYVVTDSASYNPNSDRSLSGNWTSLEPVRR